MMAGMKMSPIERLFTLGVPSADSHQKGKDSGGKQNPAMGEMVGGNQSAGQDGPSKSGQQEHGQQGEDPTQMGGMKGEGHGQAGDSGKMQHGGMDMSMTTSIKPLAIAVGLLTTIFLAALMILRPAWQLSEAAPNTNSAQQAGNMLMGKYMMAFEGAGLLILVGIFGAVLLARAGRFPDTSNREAEVAVDGKPAPIETEALEPLRGEPLDLEPEAAPEIHADKRS
jgi:NADH-quinone oxidoreductase subunit J